jgi:hypothetical protein
VTLQEQVLALRKALADVLRAIADAVEGCA